MSDIRKKELIKRYNELAEKHNSTSSWSLKGYYAGEMAVIIELLKANKGE